MGEYTGVCNLTLTLCFEVKGVGKYIGFDESQGQTTKIVKERKFNTALQIIENKEEKSKKEIEYYNEIGHTELTSKIEWQKKRKLCQR